ncbi:MAG: glycosyltransferase [Nostoc sp. RI_552]|nr:glycosyltransferase [Nostoc sp. RI_552]
MKILYIVSTYCPVLGGTETIVKKVSEILLSQGHDVRVVTSNVSEVSGYYKFGVKPLEVPEIEKINGVQVNRLLYCDFWYNLGSSWLIRNLPSRIKISVSGRIMSLIRQDFEKKISHEIESFKPDVVVTLPHLVVNVECVLNIHNKKSFPLVIFPLLHEQDINWPFERMKAALSQADAVIGVTSYECERLESFYQVIQAKLFYLPLGVDIPSVSSQKKIKKQILFLGRKTISKGIPMLLDAMNLVWNRIPDVDLILAGARVDETKEIDSIIAKNCANRDNAIISLDNLSEDEKSKLLLESTCLVLPSEIESFGLVLLEAWANSTPVITLDLEVFRSIVSHQVDGILVKPYDIKNMAKAIIYLLENPKAAEDMGKAGRLKVEDIFNWEKFAQGSLVCYQYAISQYHKQ